MSVVRPTGLISPDTILDAIETQTSQNSNAKVKYRGLLRKYNEYILKLRNLSHLNYTNHYI